MKIKDLSLGALLTEDAHAGIIVRIVEPSHILTCQAHCSQSSPEYWNSGKVRGKSIDDQTLFGFSNLVEQDPRWMFFPEYVC